MSVENLHKGFTHVFVTTFPNTAGRDAYLPDEHHNVVVNLCKDVADDLVIVDFQPAVEKSAYYS